MRILYFHQHFGTPQGSTGTRSYAFARALIAKGHRVTMICGVHALGGTTLPYDPRRAWYRGVIDGIDVIALPLAYSNHDGIALRTATFLRFAARSAWLALREDYDLLFATSTPLTAALPGLAMKLCGRCKPFVFEVRDLWPELPRALGLRNPLLLGGMSMLEWLSYHCADACIGLSPGIVDGIRRRSPKRREIVMIPNGCDLGMFRPGRREELSIAQIPAGSFAAVFIGAHGIANGLDAVLDSAAELLNRGRRDINLVMIGDGREKARLIRRAEAEALTNCIFLPPVRKSELARVTGCFDCGLMILADVPAFYFGTSPNKFFDYISAGLPVLNNYPGWLADLITENQCGLAVAPNNAAAFADALCRLADDVGLRRRMGSQARALAQKCFSRERLNESFVTLIERVAKRRRSWAGASR